MSKYEVVFYQNKAGKIPVLDFIKKLNTKDQAKIAWTLNLLSEHGKSLPLPYLKFLHGTKQLWELRPKNYRIFLSFLPESQLILLHGIIKKTNKTPPKDLELSITRLTDYKRRNSL